MKTNMTVEQVSGAPRRWPNFASRARSFVLGITLLLAALFSGIRQTQAAGVQIAGNLANFDVRYPNSLPNDFEIIIYGVGLTPADVISTFNNPFWGPAQPVIASVNNDPTSPAFGLDCLTVRWVGPPLPAMVGQMLHFGVRLRIGVAVMHQEAWWTINGVRILRPCDPHVTWICTRGFWIITITNPTPVPMYIYGCRWFQPATTAQLPQLSQLNTNINPVQFGAIGWTQLPAPPTPGGVFCIPPWCRIFLRVPVISWRPIIFQLAARNVGADVLPLPLGTTAPNPNDFDGENGTMAILTTRPTEEFAEDINGDGVIGIPDFNMLRSNMGRASADLTGN